MKRKPKLGQNFLVDDAACRRIVDALGDLSAQTVVEIGPGHGALTWPVLERCGALHVVEIDRDVIPHLQATCAGLPGLQIHLADALRFDYATLAPPGARLRLIGNLPYNISTPLLFHLLTQAPVVADMHFMLQKEVVERICAEPGTEAYGRLTVALAARARAAQLFTVGPGAFKPAPKVDSAIVRITPQAPGFPIPDLARYDRLVAAAFSQRRKTLSNGLKGLLDADAIRSAGIDPGIRAERLAPEDFARLGALIP